MDRVKWFSALGAVLIVCAMVTILILHGHADALQVAAIGVGAISLALINVWKQLEKKDGPS